MTGQDYTKHTDSNDGSSAGKQTPVILIVEDNKDSREMLKILLEMWKYRVIEAADGLEAFSLSEKTPPDLILMDARLRTATVLKRRAAFVKRSIQRAFRLFFYRAVPRKFTVAPQAPSEPMTISLNRSISPCSKIRSKNISDSSIKHLLGKILKWFFQFPDSIYFLILLI